MPGRFLAGIAALIWNPVGGTYLLLHRSLAKDFAPGVWECVTGRVEQGESFEDAVLREVQEELGARAHIVAILETAHFYRGAPLPENELLGVVFACTLDHPETIRTSAEHTEHRWVTAAEAETFLTATDPSTEWIRSTIRKAETLLPTLCHS